MVNYLSVWLVVFCISTELIMTKLNPRYSFSLLFFLYTYVSREMNISTFERAEKIKSKKTTEINLCLHMVHSIVR